MNVVYNEIESFAADWLVSLGEAGHIAPGRVERRSIAELGPDDVRGADQFHAFAGIGGWSRALRLAGWPDDAPVWTGSCPCQPFSTAGQRKGADDERHLWPAWFRLIRECRPATIFGEQVASGDGLLWLDAVSADLEGEGYAVGAADLCAAGVGAPHVRQRLYFVALDVGDADADRRQLGTVRCDAIAEGEAAPAGVARALADADRQQHQPRDGRGSEEGTGARGDHEPRHRGASDGLAVAQHSQRWAVDGDRQDGRDGPNARRQETHGEPGARGALRGFWSGAEWLHCLDGKSRPAEPGTQPLAHGLSARVGRLRGYGNAIVPQVAAAFVRAVMEAA